MPTGTVKWFNPTKGFGFVQPDTGGKDIFVHISAVQRAGMQTLKDESDPWPIRHRIHPQYRQGHPRVSSQ